MRLEEFSNYIKFKDKERELNQYFDEHLLLYSLLSDKFSDDLLIDLKEDKDGCYYILHPVENIDISYMKTFYNNLQLEFYSRKFIIEASMSKNNIKLRFRKRV
jgi:hypothetical protein